MEKIKLGKSNLEISRIVFGAWAIGGSAWGGNDLHESKKAIISSVEAGITSIDTAPIYGYGQSERIIGDTLKESSLRSKVKILTKFGLNWNTNKGQYYFSGEYLNKKYNVYRYAGKDGMIKECEDSLKRLKTDYIDLLQIHRSDSSTEIEETMEGFEILKSQGKILECGVSNYNLSQLKESLSFQNIICNQLPYSMLERDIEREIVPFTSESNVGILAYSPLQRGILTGKYKGAIDWKDDDHRKNEIWFQNENRVRINKFLENIKVLANKYDCTLSQLVINWTLQQKGISAVLVGIRNEKQVIENAMAMSFVLNEEDKLRIDEELIKLNFESTIVT